MKMAAGDEDGGDDGSRHRRANHGEELLAKLRQGNSSRPLIVINQLSTSFFVTK
jgi:hypothetical protein